MQTERNRGVYLFGVPSPSDFFRRCLRLYPPPSAAASADIQIELRYALNESPLFVLSAEGKKAILNPLSSPEEDDRRVEVDLDAVIDNLLRQGLEVVNNR